MPGPRTYEFKICRAKTPFAASSSKGNPLILNSFCCQALEIDSLEHASEEVDGQCLWKDLYLNLLIAQARVLLEKRHRYGSQLKHSLSKDETPTSGFKAIYGKVAFLKEHIENA